MLGFPNANSIVGESRIARFDSGVDVAISRRDVLVGMIERVSMGQELECLGMLGDTGIG